MLSAIPLGATSEDTGEFLLGRIAVVPVLFESNGAVDKNTQNWTPTEIDAAIEKVRTGVQWWAETLDRLGTVHELEFVIDDSFARNPFPTPYEPIDRTSQETPLYLTPFLRAQGIEDADSLEDAVRIFNNAAREKLNTDWAFTVFLIDSSDDDDGAFAPGSEFNIAFAFAGGLYIVSPSTRPASTISHETGHIFWARDEYPGGATWTDRRGYYDAQNTNAADNKTPGFVQEISIMRSGTVLTEAYEKHSLPASTRAMLGWVDSDGDGIFDVADVPLHLEGDGRYDSLTGIFTFDGNARAVPLPNRNSSGPQNDITLNRIDRIEYRLDQGPWLTASIVDAQAAHVAFELTIGAFTTIEFRAIDDSVGVTSPILQTTGTAPIVSGASIGGYAFVDANGEGEKNPSDATLSRVTATVSKLDGSPLFGGKIEPDDFPANAIAPVIAGVKLSADGVTLDKRVGAFAGPASTGTQSFHYYNLQTARWQNRWALDRKLIAEFAEPVGLVELDAIGVATGGSYGRLEAYDAAGKLLTRFTTEELTVGKSTTMRIEDPQGRIASIRAFGHQFSEVGLDSLRFGTDSSVVTGSDGVFRFAGLPDGSYKLSLAPERLIHQFAGSGATVTVSGGVAAPVIAGFVRVASPWRNLVERYDVDGNGVVQPMDALRIINEIARRGSRILANPSQITNFFDTSDDGAISPLDALRVINELARRTRSGTSSTGGSSNGGSLNGGVTGSGGAAFDAVLAAWDPDLEKQKNEKQS